MVPQYFMSAGVKMSELAVPGKINLEEPRYDQSTYIGRAKHFFITTNPLNLFASSQQLEEAKAIVERYRWTCCTMPLVPNAKVNCTKNVLWGQVRLLTLLTNAKVNCIRNVSWDQVHSLTLLPNAEVNCTRNILWCSHIHTSHKATKVCCNRTTAVSMAPSVLCFSLEGWGCTQNGKWNLRLKKH